MSPPSLQSPGPSVPAGAGFFHDKTITLVNPATEAVLAQVPRQGIDEAAEAVDRAKAAFPAWRAIEPAQRARLLERLAQRIEEQSEDLAITETRNVGKPISDSRAEVSMVAAVFRFYAGAIDKHRGATVPVAGGVDMTFHEPLGVVAAIVPWNFPLAICSWKVAPALACGNTVVVKPAELTPLTAMRLAELALEVGIPQGVLQVVVGPGSSVGSFLVEHPDVAKVAFTGSTEAGRDVMAKAAGTIKRVTLELGGKSANIVFADADLEEAARAAPGAVFANAGQDCCARSRILVQRSVFDRFMELFIESTRAFVTGDPEDPSTAMGPLVTDAHRSRVAAFLEPPGTGVEIVAKSDVPSTPGWWYPATVVVPATARSQIWREEIFGPIAAVMPFDDEEEAVRLANDTPYGLSGSVWTKDVGRTMRMARAIDSGVLSFNSNTSVRVPTPFGGVKQSGFGRELGLEALGEFSYVKNVYVSEA